MYNFFDIEYLFKNILNARFAFIFLLILFISVAFTVISIIANWKLFKKAGKKGWESLVPFYNSYVYVEISGLNWWWFLLIIAPNIIVFAGADLIGIASLASFFGTFNCFYNIARKFKKDTAISVCAGIFNFIFVFIFAFSKNEKYYTNEKVSENGILGLLNDDKVKNNDNANNNYCVNCGAKLEENYKFCPKCGKEL